MAHVYTVESNFENIADAIRSKNGTDNTYAPSDMASAIEKLKVGELDFSQIYDQEQANELNQYYKDGIAYAEQIKAENPNSSGIWLDKFFQNNRLVFMPKLNLQNVTSLQKTWSGCQNLVFIDYIDAPNVITSPNMLSFCSSLRGVVRINIPNTKSIYQCFFNGVNIDEIHITSVAKCTNFTQAFYVNLPTNIPSTKVVHLEEWKQGDIDLKYYSLLEAESPDYIIENAIYKEDGATDRTLTLHATAGANWDANSKYQGEERNLILTQKGIEVIW